MIILKGHSGLDRIFRTQAKCANDDVKKSLRMGGFVYLTYSYPTINDSQYVIPTANIADHTGTDPLKCKLIYPVLIPRPEDKKNPRYQAIDDSGLITILVGGFECFVNPNSYVSDVTMPGEGEGPAKEFPEIVPGTPLKIMKFTVSELEQMGFSELAQYGDRAMLVGVDEDDDLFKVVVAYALTGVLTNGEIRIKWLG